MTPTNNKLNANDGPGPQWFWKLTLTVLCVVAGGILLLRVFGVW